MLLVWGVSPMLAFPNWRQATAASGTVSGLPAGRIFFPRPRVVLQFGVIHGTVSGAICNSLHGKGLLIFKSRNSLSAFSPGSRRISQVNS